MCKGRVALGYRAPPTPNTGSQQWSAPWRTCGGDRLRRGGPQRQQAEATVTGIRRLLLLGVDQHAARTSTNSPCPRPVAWSWKLALAASGTVCVEYPGLSSTLWHSRAVQTRMQCSVSSPTGSSNDPSPCAHSGWAIMPCHHLQYIVGGGSCMCSVHTS